MDAGAHPPKCPLSSKEETIPRLDIYGTILIIATDCGTTAQKLTLLSVKKLGKIASYFG